MSESIMKTKKCSKCKVEQELSCFSKSNNSRDGLQYVCKKCIKKYYDTNRNKIILNVSCNYQRNKEEKLESARMYRNKNKNKISICNKKYRKSNIEKVRKINREYYLNSKDKRIEYKKNNKNRIEEKRKEYYKNNKDKIKKYNKSEKGKAALLNSKHKRRAITKNGDVTTQQLLDLEQNAKVCYWCNCSLKKVKVHLDHYIPLSKGGLHTLSNLVVSCQKCNCSKNAKDPIEFANKLGRLL